MKAVSFFMIFILLLSLMACNKQSVDPFANAVTVMLSNTAVTVDGQPAETKAGAAVYVANDVVYYEEGHDFTYGEGTAADAHSKEEAAAHTVVHVTKAGTYRFSGVLSRGQIAIDLGKNAENDPNAVVTLVLDGLDITCTVAPAVIFYNVYECDTAKTPSKDVDTTAAGANVMLAEGSTNTVNGSYVARIYKPDSVKLSDDGTKVEDAKKLHKYDGAFYSRMSMNVFAEGKGSGTLNIYAENEGLDSERHLTLNGGDIRIRSGNDGINANEDGVSVVTVNSGCLDITVTGETGEGDGIDSNGWLVINNGKVTARACANSADAGIDSDMGIHINGGEITATGHMLDKIESGGQSYVVFNFSQEQTDGTLFLKHKDDLRTLSCTVENAFSVLVYSSPSINTPTFPEGAYTLWNNNTQLVHAGGEVGMRPQGRPEMPGETPPEPPQGGIHPEKPEGDFPPPNNETPPERPEGGQPPFGQTNTSQESSAEFVIQAGVNFFSGITAKV